MSPPPSGTTIEEKRFITPLVLSFQTCGAVIPNEIALSFYTSVKPSASKAAVEKAASKQASNEVLNRNDKSRRDME
ncbi:MAG: hypothetical protein P1U77_27130 [Rubripirellula sp.]|nr:hypothetical protein [Rubripirellula sp.]